MSRLLSVSCVLFALSACSPSTVTQPDAGFPDASRADAFSLSADQDGWNRFSVYVPTGTDRLEVATSGGSGDADLYVRHGDAPTVERFDCGSQGQSNDERCVIEAPAQGTWHIGVHAYVAYEGVDLMWDVVEHAVPTPPVPTPPPPPTPPVDDAECAGSIGSCWQGCIDRGTSTSSCANSCPMGDGTGCYALCEARGQSTSTCENICGVPTGAAQAACVDLALLRGQSTSTAANICGSETSCGQEACIDLALERGQSTSTGANICGSDTPCGQAACFDLALERGQSTSTGANICGTDTACGQIACYELCEERGQSASTCRNICGFSDDVCTGCGHQGSVVDACFDVCLGRGQSVSTCSNICE